MIKRMILFAVLMLALLAIYLSYQTYTQKQQAQHIFCETLKPGMPIDEVFNSLKTFGTIQYNFSEVKESGYDEIAMGYTDKHVVGQNTYILSFQDGKYMGVSVIVFLDDVDWVCD